MTTSTIDNSQRTAAKVAGFAGLLAVAIVVSPTTRYSALFSSEAMRRRRLGISWRMKRNFVSPLTCFLTYSASVVVLLAALYVILKTSKSRPCLGRSTYFDWSLRYCGFLARSICWARCDFWVTLVTCKFSKQIGCKSWPGFPSPQLSTITMSVCHFLGWPRRFAPGCGLSRITSRKRLAVFGVISSAWCVICAFVFLIFPGFAKPVNPYWFDSPMTIFEMILELLASV